MSIRTEPNKELARVATRWMIGFTGALGFIFVTPRLVRFLIRQYAFRLLAEIVAIVTFGLLVEKAMEWSTRGPTKHQSEGSDR